jgi:hypothetical protein
MCVVCLRGCFEVLALRLHRHHHFLSKKQADVLVNAQTCSHELWPEHVASQWDVLLMKMVIENRAQMHTSCPHTVCYDSNLLIESNDQSSCGFHTAETWYQAVCKIRNACNAYGGNPIQMRAVLLSTSALR